MVVPELNPPSELFRNMLTYTNEEVLQSKKLGLGLLSLFICVHAGGTSCTFP